MNIFSKNIIKEWNLTNLPLQKQKEMIERIGRILYQAILVRSLDILSQDEQEELDSILDNDNTLPEDIIKFLQSKIPTFDQLVKDERNSLKEDLLMPVS